MQHVASSPAARASALRTGVIALAVAQLAQGLILLLAPGPFYDALANFGPENHHDLRDMSAFYLASGVVLAAAARRPAWRAPALALVGLQFAVHAVNHVLDAGDSDPGWVGPFDAVSLVAAAVLIALLYRAAAQESDR
jgi:peptidoglycan/LPS O-acetylase OafA/YrhL